MATAKKKAAAIKKPAKKATSKKVTAFLSSRGRKHAQNAVQAEQKPEDAPLLPPGTHPSQAEIIDGFTAFEYMTAYYLSRGIPGHLASTMAGDISARSRRGIVTVLLLRRPPFRALVKKLVLDQIAAKELDDRLGAMCRGDHPTKITDGPDGPRLEYDMLEAQTLANRIAGRLREHVSLENPDGTSYARLSDEALDAEIAKLAAKRALALKP